MHQHLPATDHTTESEYLIGVETCMHRTGVCIYTLCVYACTMVDLDVYILIIVVCLQSIIVLYIYIYI